MIWLGQEHVGAQLEELTVDQPSGTATRDRAESKPTSSYGVGGLGCCHALMWLQSHPIVIEG